MNSSEIKQWIMENIEIYTSLADGNDVYVGLRFKGEEDCFTSDLVFIPSYED